MQIISTYSAAESDNKWERTMRSLVTAAAVFVIFASQSSTASCLQDIVIFANGICGAIEKSGSKSTIDASGKLDVKIGNIVTKIIGAGSGDLSGKVLEDSYKGVLQNQLGAELFNVRDCRQKMVEVASKKCIDASDSKSSVDVGSKSKITAPIYDTNMEFVLHPGETSLLTKNMVVIAYSLGSCGARSDLVCIRLAGKDLFLAVGQSADFNSKDLECSVVLMEKGSGLARFLLRC
jgi:hypothetical protein